MKKSLSLVFHKQGIVVPYSSTTKNCSTFSCVTYSLFAFASLHFRVVFVLLHQLCQYLPKIANADGSAYTFVCSFKQHLCLVKMYIKSTCGRLRRRRHRRLRLCGSTRSTHGSPTTADCGVDAFVRELSIVHFIM